MRYCRNCGELPATDFYVDRPGRQCRKCLSYQVMMRAARREAEEDEGLEREVKEWRRPRNLEYVEPLTFSGLMDLFYQSQDLRSSVGI